MNRLFQLIAISVLYLYFPEKLQYCMSQDGVPNGIDKQSLMRVQKSLVMIESRNGKGTGFLASMGGRTYLFSNDHVLRMGIPITAKLIDGTPLVFSQIEASDTRDLVRLPLDTPPDTSLLSLHADDVVLGERIFVFGNSDGSGVMTYLQGKILGIGPELIEIDAQFVSGNSGSPIVLHDGSVVGVATFATFSPAPGDWLKEKTRFTQVRRFGVRLQDAKWIPMSMEDYSRRVNNLADLETFCNDFCDLYFSQKFKSRDAIRYQANDNIRRYRTGAYFPNQIEGICEIFRRWRQWPGETDIYKSYGPTSGPTSERMRQEQPFRERAQTLLYTGTLASIQQKAPTLSSNLGKHNQMLMQRLESLALDSDWKTKRMAGEAQFWFEVFRSLITQI